MYEMQSKKNFDAKKLCKCVICGESKCVYVKRMGFNVILKSETYNSSCESAIKEAIIQYGMVRLEGTCWDCIQLDEAVYPNEFQCFHCRNPGTRAGHRPETGISLSSKFPQRRMCPVCAKASIPCFYFPL